MPALRRVRAGRLHEHGIAGGLRATGPSDDVTALMLVSRGCLGPQCRHNSYAAGMEYYRPNGGMMAPRMNVYQRRGLALLLGVVAFVAGCKAGVIRPVAESSPIVIPAASTAIGTPPATPLTTVQLASSATSRRAVLGVLTDNVRVDGASV